MADRPGSLHDLDRGLPARCERQLDEHLDLGVQLFGRRDHPGRVAGKIVEVAQRRLGRLDPQAGQTAPGQAEQAARPAGIDHADRERRLRRNLARHLAELPVRHHQPARGGRIRALPGQLPGGRLDHESAPGPHSVESSTGVSKEFIGSG